MKVTLKTAIVLANSLSPLFQAVAGQKSSVTFSDNPTASIGAAYCEYTSCFATCLTIHVVMSNDPSGNYVFSADIGSDAKLVGNSGYHKGNLLTLLKTLAKGYYTGGNGSHGVGPTPDALFSQGAMFSSESHDVVIAVNVSKHLPHMPDNRTYGKIRRGPTLSRLFKSTRLIPRN